jgi:DNA-binding LytR/AlgR family response regulator
MRVYVEAFNLAVKALGLSRTHRNAITNREAVKHIQGSNSGGH